MQKKSSNQKVGNRRAGSRNLKKGNINPPQFSSNVRLAHKFRFTASSAFGAYITDTQVLGVCGSICTVTNSTVALFAESIRIKKIEIWAAPASQGANSTCSVDWVGFGNSPNIQASDTTLSVSKNAHVVTSPPPNSLCHFWQKATGTGLFSLTCPINSIVDLSLDIILADQEVAISTATVATGVLGHIYYMYLDGTTTHLLVPVSLNTTF